MTKHYDTVAETKYDGLIAHATPSPLVFSVVIKKGDAVRELKRGMILTTEKDDEDIAYAILADDITVGEEEDAICTAYRTGHFARNLVFNEDGSAVTPEQEDSLRGYGILLSDVIPV